MRRRTALAVAPVALALAACGTKAAETPPTPAPPPTPDAGALDRARHEIVRQRTFANRLRHMLKRERRLNVGVRFARIAVSQRGTPYVWGGSSPGGFDCSGLVSWSGARVGRSLPHYTGALIRMGREVSATIRSRWQVGDLLFPHGGHVGIYVGDGRVVEAPHSGAVVRIAAARPPIAVRRVIA